MGKRLNNNKTLRQMSGVNYPAFSNSHQSVCFSSNGRRHCSVNNIWSLLNVFFFFKIASKSRSAVFWRRMKTSPAWEICTCTLGFVCWTCRPWLKTCYVIVTELHSSGKRRSADLGVPQDLSTLHPKHVMPKCTQTRRLWYDCMCWENRSRLSIKLVIVELHYFLLRS